MIFLIVLYSQRVKENTKSKYETLLNKYFEKDYRKNAKEIPRDRIENK